ncbi:MAG: tRNA dihydrouridine synthase DusB [Clostridia bacterium]|nr:tRNA dihydrouridine synthase DusB [Clostridia bacterium]
MAGITDAPFRLLCEEQGAGLSYTEMISAKGLWYKDKNTAKLSYTYPEEKNVAIQIFGHEPDIMAFAAEKLDPLPNKILDINIGCPVPKVVKNHDGSYMMHDPENVYQVVKAMVGATDKPVSAKIRLGWDENHINAVEVAHALQSAGASAIAVHGRTREQFYEGKANWDEIRKVKESVSIPVIANGDVVDLESAKAIMETTGCDMVMIARGALGNPWLFKELNMGEKYSPSNEEKRDTIIRHLNMLVALKGEYVAVREMRKHIGWYMKGMHGAAKFRGRINQIDNLKELQDEIVRLFDC